MSQLIKWSDKEAEELLNFTIELLNGCETRNRIIQKIQKMTGLRCNSCDVSSSCDKKSEKSVEIRSFSRFKDDKIGKLIDRYFNRKLINAILPETIKKAFSAFNSLKETCLQKSNVVRKEKELDASEYCLMITVFTESIIYYCVGRTFDELKGDYNSNISNISMWASPYLTKNIIQKIDNKMLQELSEYGITMKVSWLGDEARNNLYRGIKKMDYKGSFISSLSTKSSLGINFRYITLEGDEIRDEMLFYFKTIETIPNELNAKLGRNLNIASKSIYILSIEPNRTGFIIKQNSESFIPGSKIGIIYFPCKDVVNLNCKNITTNKSVELELSDDKLVIIDLSKNKYTFRNNTSGIVTYCILTYIFGPT